MNYRGRSASFLLLVGVLLVGHADLGLAGPALGRDKPSRPPDRTGVGEEPGPETEAADVVHLFWHEAVGGPAFLGTESLRATDLDLPAGEAQDPKAMALAFLQAYGSELRAATGETRWKPLRTEAGDGGAHTSSCSRCTTISRFLLVKWPCT